MPGACSAAERAVLAAAVLQLRLEETGVTGGPAGRTAAAAARARGADTRDGTRGKGDKCGPIRHNTRFSFVHFAGNTARL